MQLNECQHFRNSPNPTTIRLAPHAHGHIRKTSHPYSSCRPIASVRNSSTSLPRTIQGILSWLILCLGGSFHLLSPTAGGHCGGKLNPPKRALRCLHHKCFSEASGASSTGGLYLAKNLSPLIEPSASATSLSCTMYLTGPRRYPSS